MDDHAPATAPSAGGGDVLERLGLTVMTVALLAGLGLLAARPAALLAAPAEAVVPAMVHLFTLGGVLGAYFAIQRRNWRAAYGPPAARRRGALRGLFALVLLCQAVGLVLLAWGFATRDSQRAYLGGHYILPAAIVLFEALGALLARGRRSRPVQPMAHLPGLGLLLAMSLGSLLVMDASTGRYGVYGPATVLLHALAAGFLFLFPLILSEPHGLGFGRPRNPPGTAGGSPWGSPLAGALSLLGAGVLLVAIGQSRPEWPWALPLGLAVLGGVLLWVGLPGSAALSGVDFGAVRRTPWAAVGMVALFAAIRVWRGAEGGELLAIARFGAVLFLFVAALPDLLARLSLHLRPVAPDADPAGGAVDGAPLLVAPVVAVHYAVQLLGAGLLVAALATGVAGLVQAGALVWGLSLLAWAWHVLRAPLMR
jgi:hypothetical protein